MERAATSDFMPRPNLMSREEFLRRILYSGEITKVGQHLALVIFLLAEGGNQVRTSVRDLERITGWTRTAINDHLSELDVFMKRTFGGGRAKTLFELQGVIEDAIAAAVVSGSLPATADTTVVSSQPDAIASNEAAATADTKPCGQPDGHKTEDHSAVASSQPDATDEAKKKGLPHTPSKEKLSLSQLESEDGERAREADATAVRVNCSAIYGPGFTLDFAAIDIAASLIGMSKERARSIAEICARDWAANGKPPSHPMAMIKKALKSDQHTDAIQEIQLAKASSGGPPRKTFRR